MTNSVTQDPQFGQFERMADDLADMRLSARHRNAHLFAVESARDVLAEVAQRLLDDHVMRSPHHADLCQLCIDANAALAQAKATTTVQQ